MADLANENIGHPVKCEFQMNHKYIFSVFVFSVFVTPWTVVHQAPLSMEFFRQEY